MSKHRIRPDAGHVDLKTHPRGPNGCGLCRWCSKEVPVGKKTFCNDSCIHEFKIRSNPGYARKQVFKRDRGKCAECGETRFEFRERNYRGVMIEAHASSPVWEMDHTVPVIEGGGECGLDGLRTLCKPCHKKATAALAARRALARKTPCPGAGTLPSK